MTPRTPLQRKKHRLRGAFFRPSQHTNLRSLTVKKRLLPHLTCRGAIITVLLRTVNNVYKELRFIEHVFISITLHPLVTVAS